MFMSFDVCDSARSVSLVGGAAWELAHNDTTTNEGTSARRATNDRGVYLCLFTKKETLINKPLNQP